MSPCPQSLHFPMQALDGDVRHQQFHTMRQQQCCAIFCMRSEIPQIRSDLSGGIAMIMKILCAQNPMVKIKSCSPMAHGHFLAPRIAQTQLNAFPTVPDTAHPKDVVKCGCRIVPNINISNKSIYIYIYGIRIMFETAEPLPFLCQENVCYN